MLGESIMVNANGKVTPQASAQRALLTLSHSADFTNYQ